MKGLEPEERDLERREPIGALGWRQSGPVLLAVVLDELVGRTDAWEDWGACARQRARRVAVLWTEGPIVEDRRGDWKA